MQLRALFLPLLLVASCGLTVEDPGTDEVVVASAASAFSTSALKWLNGTYSNCASRSGAWSVRVSGSATMDNAALTVVKADASCRLLLTSVVADQTYAASPSITLDTTYAATAATFGTGNAAFAGNAKLDAMTYAADFQITFLYEDRSTTPVVTDSLISASYTTVTSYASATTVTPPNYNIDTSALKFAADPIKLIYGVTGSATLSGATTTGTSYVIDANTLSTNPSFTEVGNAFGTAVLTQKSISSQPVTIAASELGIVTLSLVSTTIVRNIIVRRTVSGTSAYQVFRITFSS